MKTEVKLYLIICTVLLFFFCALQTGLAEEYADRVVEEFHTVVDFYTNIKGVEYVYCVVYLFFFTIFYPYVFKE